MSLVSGTIRRDGRGSRPRVARMRGRLTLPLAIVLSVVLAGSGLAQSPVPATSPLPGASAGPAASTAPVSLEGTPWTLAEPLLENPYSVSLLLRDGIATGAGSCNDYVLPSTLTGSYIAFGLPGVTSPPRTCDAAATTYETAYLAKLATVSSFVILDHRLLLVDDTGTAALTYVTEPQRAVEGDWVVSGFRTADDSAATLVPGTTLTLALLPDGTADGYRGCSRFATSYVVDADALTFGPIAAPLIACPDPDVQAQADGYLAALASVQLWSWDRFTLVLSSAPDVASVELVPAGTPAFVGTWVTTAIAGPDGSLQPPVTDSAPTLDVLSGDSVTGSTGCNAIFGHLCVAGSVIGIGPIASTRVACSTSELTSQETAYLAALTAAASWTMEDGVLSLFTMDGASLVTLVAATVVPVPSPSPEATTKPTPEPTVKPTPKPPPKPSASPVDVLDGTTWILSRFDDGAGDVISVPVQDETPTASFGSGPIIGFAGCNRYTGSYALDGSKIRLGTLVTTTKACDDLGTAVETIFLVSLDQVTKWKVSDKGKLGLRGADGAPVLTSRRP